MFYTRLGEIVAGIAVFIGAIYFSIGLLDAFGSGGQLSQVYFNKSSGEVIDKGLLYILFAIALGVITEISRSVAKDNK